jgi:hypothetical protein
MAQHLPPGQLPGQGGAFVSDVQGVVDQISVVIPKTQFKEASAFIAKVNFRNRTDAEGVSPATARYKIDCMTTRREILGWQTLAPSSSLSINVTSNDNAIQSDSNAYEIRRMTIAVDENTPAQYQDTIDWKVVNIS